MKNSIYIITGGIALTLLSIMPARAATGSCEAEGSPGSFTTCFSSDWTKEQNVEGAFIELTSGTTSGDSYKMACNCPAATRINLFYSTTTPLAASSYGGYRQLNNNLDIKTVITDVPGVPELPVPTDLTSVVKGTGVFGASTNNSVCSADPDDVRADALSVGSNVSITFRVSKAFLGRMEIPSTHIATLKAAWSSNSTYPKGLTEDVARLYIQGSITVPL